MKEKVLIQVRKHIEINGVPAGLRQALRLINAKYPLEE
jgi:hypothetical protein